MSNKRIIGALSGTSMDGVSVGLFEFNENDAPKTIAAGTYPVPTNYKDELLALIKERGGSFDAYGQTDRWVGEVFADAILEFLNAHNIDPNSIDAIGSHGQTIWHAPHLARPFTLQIGDANIIAEKTGITTVADFRRADMAAGGCGAPLAPAFHLAVFADPKKSRCIVNVGGFSNVSVLNGDIHRGHDTGPGNCLMDYWVKTHFNMEFDAAGDLAASGKVNQNLLNLMLADPFFARPAPKSTGREYFNPQWLEQKLQANAQQINKVDVLTTLLHLTAISISNEIKRYAPPTTQVFICGGGAHNLELRKQLGLLLEQNVASTAELGIDPDCVEAALFAWLAFARLNNQPINLMPITGSKHPVILGGIYAAQERVFKNKAKRFS